MADGDEHASHLTPIFGVNDVEDTIGGICASVSDVSKTQMTFFISSTYNKYKHFHHTI